MKRDGRGKLKGKRTKRNAARLKQRRDENMAWVRAEYEANMEMVYDMAMPGK